MEDHAAGQRDSEGRRRRCYYLPDDLIEWVDRIAARDKASPSDLVEGLILLGKDAEDDRARRG